MSAPPEVERGSTLGAPSKACDLCFVDTFVISLPILLGQPHAHNHGVGAEIGIRFFSHFPLPATWAATPPTNLRAP